MTTIADILIVGGGINGCGIAADAAGRGLSVILCEQNDLASATSSASSKLIHGGLRYLEYGEFNLVGKALREREIMLRKAPHIIWPLQFIMPYRKGLRPAWLIRLGLFLYDHLGGRQTLAKSQGIRFHRHAAGEAIKPIFNKGFIYSDCWVDDARLVVLNAIAAKENGGTILTRTKLIEAKRYPQYWEATLLDQRSGNTLTFKTKTIVNAAGPWVEDILKMKLNIPSKNHIALVKGSHIVVPALYTGDFAFILQHVDKRIVFILPYQKQYSLIGTTDVAYSGNPAEVAIDAQEIDYLLQIANTYFRRSHTPENIVWHYSGVRALKKDEADSPAAITRDYELELNIDAQHAPLLSIFGGKITTYRVLAENALSILLPYLACKKEAWTADSPLPGGDIPDADFKQFFKNFCQEYSWLDPILGERYARSYGTRANKLLDGIQSVKELGIHYGHGLYEAELNYLYKNEWAFTAEDILWRRTKLGLHFNEEQTRRVEEVLKSLQTRQNFS